jgi:hypothetical protein
MIKIMEMAEANRRLRGKPIQALAGPGGDGGRRL